MTLGLKSRSLTEQDLHSHLRPVSSSPCSLALDSSDPQLLYFSSSAAVASSDGWTAGR